MFLQKEKVLLLVKLCGFIFLSFMFITALLQMNQMTKEKQYSAKDITPLSPLGFDTSINSNTSEGQNKKCGSSPFSFFIYAFILGAFWNVKKIQKLGLL